MQPADFDDPDSVHDILLAPSMYLSYSVDRQWRFGSDKYVTKKICIDIVYSRLLKLCVQYEDTYLQDSYPWEISDTKTSLTVHTA